MMRQAAFLAAGSLTACTAVSQDGPLDYQGVSVDNLGRDLVSVQVALSGITVIEQVQAYADCAAAQYALDEGYGYVRHLRRKVDQEGGIWRGDAVYTLSKTRPEGTNVIDADSVVFACVENGTPTV
ncbi:MAG: hypothetical protein AAGA12_11520 [Pseudomonadota bacterium]